MLSSTTSSEKHPVKRKASADLEMNSKFFKKLKAEDESPRVSGTPIVSASTVATRPLSQLLDLSDASDEAQIQERFEAIAQSLFFQNHIRITNETKDGAVQTTNLEILEMEFYLIKPHVHEDPFCHGSVEQQTAGQWYFHKAPTRNPVPISSKPATKVPTAAGGYRGGTRKGLDLTLGSPNSASSQGSTPKTRGGILLRSVRNLRTSKVISGPSLLVDAILQLSGASTIQELVSKRWSGDISAFRSNEETKALTTTMHLVPIEPTTTSAQTIYRSPRIGLDLTNPSTTPSADHPRVNFIQKRYRYIIHPKLLKANGQPETFLALLYHQAQVEALSVSKSKESFQPPLFNRGMALHEISQTSGVSQKTVERYWDHYKTGLDSGALAKFCGAAGKALNRNAENILKMYGALTAL